MQRGTIAIFYQEFGKVDFGAEIGVKQTSAQVTAYYPPESLVGRQVVGCINLCEENIARFTSEFLLVGFPDNGEAICLAAVAPKVPNGKKMF